MKQKNYTSIAKGIACFALLATQAPPVSAAPDRVAKTYQAWTVQCVNRLNDAGQVENTNCELYQEIVEQTTGGRVLRISLLPDAETLGATAVFLTPSGVELHNYFSLTARSEGQESQPREDLFKTCQATGCSAVFDLKPDDLERVLSSDALDVAFSFPGQPEPIQISVSPNGLREAYEELIRGE
jgi:invasion protein IalB